MLTGIFPDKSTGKNPPVVTGCGSGHIPTMDLSSKIARLMEEKGLNPHSTASRARLPEDTVRDIVRGKTKDPGASKLLRIARVLDTSIEALLSDDDAPPAPVGSSSSGKEILLPVAYSCAAGVFLETDDSSQVEPRMEPAEYFPTYARWPQWLEVVEGDSIDKLIPSGALIHVVDAQAMGYAPANGDIVVVQRTRLGGLLRERTVKQIGIDGNGVKLWPRSHNPSFQTPLDLAAGTVRGDDVQVTIVGKVLQAYIRFGRD
jgi:transcriptional regulator with XRE-family HTH domain